MQEQPAPAGMQLEDLTSLNEYTQHVKENEKEAPCAERIAGPEGA